MKNSTRWNVDHTIAEIMSIAAEVGVASHELIEREIKGEPQTALEAPMRKHNRTKARENLLNNLKYKNKKRKK